eukprot:scaffold433718_cov37-Prasinocladus_malaysianus.AAC.1
MAPVTSIMRRLVQDHQKHGIAVHSTRHGCFTTCYLSCSCLVPACGTICAYAICILPVLRQTCETP